MNGLWKKTLPLAALILPTIVSFALLGLTVSKAALPNSLTSWIKENRATTQLIVQILSAVLAALQNLAIGSTVSFYVNLQALSNSVSLDTLKLWNAVVLAHFDTELSFLRVVVLAIYISLTISLGSLWTGALTPVTATLDVAGHFQLPAYSTSSNSLWGQLCSLGEPCPTNLEGKSSEMGTFTYLPWKYQSGLLLNSVEQASSLNATSKPQRRKLDNTGYIFNGRSYGVASTVGLAKPSMRQPEGSRLGAPIPKFNYPELGYISTVTCNYNEASDLSFYPMAAWAQGLYPWNAVGFVANGSLPNGKWTGFPIWGVNDNSTLMAIGAVASQARYIYGFAAGKYYAELSMVECETTFTPSMFHVNVDTSAKSITVTPDPANNADYDIDPSRALLNTSFFTPSYLSATLTSGYTSVLGHAFQLNVGNVQERNNHSVASSIDVLKATEESLETLIDHSFGSLGAAQFMVANDTRSMEASITIDVLQLGTPYYIYAMLGVSWMVNISIAVVVIWTKFWRDLPTINVLDLKSVIAGTARGSQEQAIWEAASSWDGSAESRAVGRLRVKLAEDRRSLTFVVYDQGEKWKTNGRASTKAG